MFSKHAARDKCKYGFPGCEFCHKRGPGGSLRRGGQPHSAACCAATLKEKTQRAKALRESRAKPRPPADDKEKKTCKRSPEAWARRRKAKNEKKKRPRASKADRPGPLRGREINALSVGRAMTRYRTAWEKPAAATGGVRDDG